MNAAMLLNARRILARLLVIAGGIAMLAGAFDPLEGAGVILAGSASFLVGTWFGVTGHRCIGYRLLVFIMIAVGVGAMWVLSSMGGFGGDSGLSMWWGLLILPYLIGWSLGIWGPDSPRWMLWLGMVVSLWYLVLCGIITIHANPHHKDPTVAIILVTLALLTLGGCAFRLGKGVGR